MTRRLVEYLLLLLGVTLPAVLAPASALAGEDGPPYGSAALVVVVPGVSFEDLLAVPEVAALSRAGGAGLLVNPDAFTVPRVPVVPPELYVQPREDVVVLDPAGPGGLAAIGEEIRRRALAFPADELLVFVMGRESSPAMVAARDELPPIVMAEGPPVTLFPEAGVAGSLTSDSTRRDGVVSGEDVQATIVDRLGGTEETAGEPIRVVPGPPPFSLHERYLAQRRMVVPIGIGAGLYVTLVGLVAIGLLWRRRRAPAWALDGVSALALSAPALVVAMFAAGHLPSLSYATVVPFLVAVTGVAGVAVALLARRDPLRPAAWIGAGVLAFFAVEALVGWTAALTPFLGGSQLDGGRFYGLPNAFVGLLIGAPLYLVHRWRTGIGVALLALVALFAGLPGVGANLGAGVAVFATAGLWLALRERGRLGVWKGAAVVAGVTVLGTAAILVAHRISPVPTHVTRFEETAGGFAGAWSTFADRLLVGWRLIERNPFALIPVLGLLAVVWVIVRPPVSIRDGFEGRPAWRDAMLVVALGGIAAYVANDSGAAACGQAFTMSLSGTLFIALRVALGTRTEKMGGP